MFDSLNLSVRRRRWLGAALIAAAGLSAQPVLAQDMFGALEAQGAFAGQQNYAASLHAYYGGGWRDDEDDDRPVRSSPGLTAEQAARLAAESIEREAERQAEYDRWRAGSWQYFQGREDADPGEFCSAMYQNPQGIVTLSGFDDSWDGGLLMLTGDRIPKPRRFEEITVTLIQSGEAPVTIRAFNRARDPRMYDMGTIVIAVPTMEGAIEGMTDEQEFVLSVRGREVFRMAWKDGLNAAGELRKCLRGR